MKRFSALVVAVTAVLPTALSGCASATPRDYVEENLGFYAPMYPVIDAYSRNVVVCVPTAIGNVAGGVVASPLLLLLLPLDPEGLGFKAVQALFATPVYLGGVVTGTVFLPFSYAFEEDACHVPVHLGS